MTESLRTRGPWMPKRYQTRPRTPLACGCAVEREHRSWRGEAQERYTHVPCALHAAAPELLDALRETLAYIDTLREGWLREGREMLANSARDYSRAARAAIAKAEGK